MNFDLMAEYYMQPIGILSGGVFYKSLKNFIFNYIQNNYYDAVTQDTFEVYSQPRNLASAGLFGVELQLQRQLDFLPGALSGLGIFLNYTFTSSTVDGLPLEGRTTEDLRLSGSPQHSANASLSYEYGGLMLRVALNYTSDYIDEYGDGAFYDRYYDTQMFVDANASFAITPQFRIFVDANNLTNQPLQYYQGTPARMAQAEFYNARFQAGVKYDM
jgi:TonB-dependent receptor